MRRGLATAMAIVALAGTPSACGGLSEGSLTDSKFWESSPLFGANDEAELGIAELAKGNYGSAELHFTKALKRNAKDVHALIGLGLLYQNTGQLTKARQMYEAVLALHPESNLQMVVWGSLTPRPVSEIASVNLALLDGGGLAGAMAGPLPPGQGASQAILAVAQPMTPAEMPAASVTAARTSATGPVTATTPTVAAVRTAGGGLTMLSPADANIAARFKTLAMLRDQGLVTPDEFRSHRQANIGAVLPLTSPPPAAGLDRPVPPAEQVGNRLRAIGRALEMRAMTVGQHAAERTMILDALLPSAPMTVANPGAPPQGLMEAADSVRRLEQLKTDGVITSDEYTKERAAIEKIMQPPPSPAGQTKAAEGARGDASKGPQPAVHLASYRSQKDADRGWTQLRRAHQKLLGELKPEVTKADLGQGKGIYYRLKAGPFDSPAAAEEVCRELKRLRQFCEPTFLGG